MATFWVKLFFFGNVWVKLVEKEKGKIFYNKFHYLYYIMDQNKLLASFCALSFKETVTISVFLTYVRSMFYLMMHDSLCLCFLLYFLPFKNSSASIHVQDNFINR